MPAEWFKCHHNLNSVVYSTVLLKKKDANISCIEYKVSFKKEKKHDYSSQLSTFSVYHKMKQCRKKMKKLEHN